MTIHLTLIGKNIEPLMRLIHSYEYTVCNSIILYKEKGIIKSQECFDREYLRAFKEDRNTITLTNKEVERFTTLWNISQDIEITFQSILHKLSKE